MKKSELKELIKEVLIEIQELKASTSDMGDYNKQVWIELTRDWKSSQGGKLPKGSILISWLNPSKDAVWYTRFADRTIKPENISKEYFVVLNRPVTPDVAPPSDPNVAPN
jgi:hypothetical protein